MLGSFFNITHWPMRSLWPIIQAVLLYFGYRNLCRLTNKRAHTKSKSMTAGVGLVTQKPLKSFKDDFRVGQVLGTGASAAVHEGTHKKTRRKVALKIISGPKFARMNERNVMILRNEINVMEKVCHVSPALMSFLGAYEEPTRLVMVLEHLNGGELFNRIAKRGHYSEKDAAEVVGELMAGVSALHANCVVHRDLKPENCIYATPDKDSALKITDFGLACMHESAGGFGDVHQSLVGSPSYVAPEVLASRMYSPACDVWSMGVMLYILLAGYPPFWANTNTELFNIIKRGEYHFHEDAWGGVSDSAKDLVRGCLTLDPSRRLTADEVLAHPWISDFTRNSTVHMSGAIGRLATFNARRKFKAAAYATMVAIGGFKLGRRPVQASISQRILELQTASSRSLLLQSPAAPLR